MSDVIHALIQMFADDAKLFKRSVEAADCQPLVEDLTRLEEWPDVQHISELSHVIKEHNVPTTNAVWALLMEEFPQKHI